MERDLRSFGVEDKPPRISEHGGTSDINANNHVAEEQPFADKRLPVVSRRNSHDRMIRRVEAKGSCR